MKKLYDDVSNRCSKFTTTTYSTSFSLGIKLLHKSLHQPIYAIYGFVRFADEIVDTFHEYDKDWLLKQFRKDTRKAIEDGISMNPILNSFQLTVNRYDIDRDLIEKFMASMAMDLHLDNHHRPSFEEYVLGSAEVVGLMCLKVFTEGNEMEYNKLKPYAMKLGSAFQKINFLRDLNEDFNQLGRSYFPNVNMSRFDEMSKREIEAEIEEDFRMGLQGIKMLPAKARFGVYLAYVYYFALFKKIKQTPSTRIMKERIRIPNFRKYGLMLGSFLRYQFNLL